MMPEASEAIIDRLTQFQQTVQQQVIRSRGGGRLHSVSRTSAADTIYKLDTEIEPLMEEFFREWGKRTPLVLIAEGMTDETGREGAVVFPRGADENEAKIRVIVDPIDGTREMMYDKRAAWSLAGVAPNRGSNTRLRDIEIAVMTEIPTSKMGTCDVLSAIKARGMTARRVDLASGKEEPLKLEPSRAHGIEHGFATITNFFPGTKVLASEVMEHIVRMLVDPAHIDQAMIFDDQYISTGGQFYEVIAGHDRFNADLRPLFYKIQQREAGLCCHPYDCATMLIAEEAGVVLTDGMGHPLDGPLDTTTPIAWAAYANCTLQESIEPLLTSYLRELGA